MIEARREAIECLLNALPKEHIVDAMKVAEPFQNDEGKILGWDPRLVFRRPREVPKKLPSATIK